MRAQFFKGLLNHGRILILVGILCWGWSGVDAQTVAVTEGATELPGGVPEPDAPEDNVDTYGVNASGELTKSEGNGAFEVIHSDWVTVEPSETPLPEVHQEWEFPASVDLAKNQPFIGSWSLSSVSLVDNRKEKGAAEAIQMKQEVEADFPIGQTEISLDDAGNFILVNGNAEIPVTGNFAKVDSNLLFEAQTDCQTCSGVIGFEVVKVNESEMVIRMADQDNYLVQYDFQFTRNHK